jgi:DNA-binding transcriptional ArsR family regulator
MNMLTKTVVSQLQKHIAAGNDRLPIIFSALGDSGRLRVFKLLMKQRGICVGEVASILELSAPAASQQLRILETAGLLEREREGKTVCYHIKKEDPCVKLLIKMLQT